MHHPLGVAGGARGEEHRGHVTGQRLLGLMVEKLRVLLGKHGTGGQQFVQRTQPLLGVVAQPPRIVIEDVL